MFYPRYVTYAWPNLGFQMYYPRCITYTWPNLHFQMYYPRYITYAWPNLRFQMYYPRYINCVLVSYKNPPDPNQTTPKTDLCLYQSEGIHQEVHENCYYYFAYKSWRSVLNDPRPTANVVTIKSS